MGKPAARLGDMTAHGGAITGPGCPTVLIGGMPAATMGDMHVCPMVTPGTPPIPHVGGPIALGSTGVLIGGKPAARMGDMAVCVGPPSSIILGCMTVLIGEVGGGGGAGAGGGSAAAGAITSAAIAGVTPQATTVEGHFLDAEVLDDDKLPISGLRYTLEDPSNNKTGGVLGGDIKQTSVVQGAHGLNVYGIANARWSTQSAKVGNTVDLIVDTISIANGTKATLTIVVRDGNYSDHVLASIDATVSNNRIRAQWIMQVDEKYLGICGGKAEKGRYSQPFFFFVVGVEGVVVRSAHLLYKDTVSIELKGPKGKALASKKFKAVLPTGEIREGTLDSQGKSELKSVPPGTVQIKYTLIS
jgi:uncharacterized Zn-binding protein involved in type VI secretion